MKRSSFLKGLLSLGFFGPIISFPEKPKSYKITERVGTLHFSTPTTWLCPELSKESYYYTAVISDKELSNEPRVHPDDDVWQQELRVYKRHGLPMRGTTRLELHPDYSYHADYALDSCYLKVTCTYSGQSRPS